MKFLAILVALILSTSTGWTDDKGRDRDHRCECAPSGHHKQKHHRHHHHRHHHRHHKSCCCKPK